MVANESVNNNNNERSGQVIDTACKEIKESLGYVSNIIETRFKLLEEKEAALVEKEDECNLRERAHDLYVQHIQEDQAKWNKEAARLEAIRQTSDENLDQKRIEIDEREKKCYEKEREVGEREHKVEEREKEVGEREEKWIETERRMEENAGKLPSVIQLNVGGQRFSVTKEKLLKHKGSLFEKMIISDYPQTLPTGELFIERNPKYFQLVLDYIVTGEPTFSNDVLSIFEEIEEALRLEFEFYEIPFPDDSAEYSDAQEMEDGNEEQAYNNDGSNDNYEEGGDEDITEEMRRGFTCVKK